MPITLTITESSAQIIAGIPQYITLETSVPASIFYTLDGSVPSTGSDLFIDRLNLPTDEGTVLLKTFATDGAESTPIITQEFGPNFVSNRNPHDKVTGFQLVRGAGFPFSSQGNPIVQGQYLNAGGLYVNDPLEQQIPDGYDGTGTGTPSNYTNQNVYSYDLLFSETNSIGERGLGIGTIPAAVTVVRDISNSPQESSIAESAFFNPKALVIFQDASKEDYDPEVPKVNRPYFNLENEEKSRDGMLKQASEVQPPMGSALRQIFNPKDNTIQYSYFDSRTSRWIFSKVPFTPKNPNMDNYSSIVFSSRSGPGHRFVYQWLPFRYRTLF